MILMIPKVEDLKEAPIVGRWYLVRCMLSDAPRDPFLSLFFGVDKTHHWWPVIGHPHSDADLGVADVHLHHDLRFLTEKQVGMRSYAGAMIIVDRIDDADGKDRPIAYRPLKCLRTQPTFPVLTSNEYAEFERSFIGRNAKGCRTCPHRGNDLTQVPVDEEGGVVCPGHGLRWNKHTGELMPRIACNKGKAAL